MIKVSLILPLDNIEAADSTADIDTDAFFIVLGDLEPGRCQREFGRRDGELNEAPHLLDFFLFDVVRGIEPFDFAGNLAGERTRIERLNAGDSASSFPQRLPGFIGSDSHRRHQANACDYNPA